MIVESFGGGFAFDWVGHVYVEGGQKTAISCGKHFDMVTSNFVVCCCFFPPKNGERVRERVIH